MSTNTIVQREVLKGRIESLRSVSSKADFCNIAFDMFKYQLEHNVHYADWANNFSTNPETLVGIPKLHISAWKIKAIKSGEFKAETVYESSKTTGLVASRHFVKEEGFYHQNAIKAFESIYGCLEQYCILGLLPSYLERKGSSLVSMVQHFIEVSKIETSGTYLYEHEKLYNILMSNKSENIPTILIGVSFGLLDFLDTYKVDFPNLMVMETGGMKGRREEMSKEELHGKLSEGFGVESIHSEYGMTELLSQAYSTGKGMFVPAPTMKVLVTEINDPLTRAPFGKAGIINIIDLANLDSCSFICTEDVGIEYEDGSFSIIGRLDESDIRGCNLMVSDL